MSVQFNVDCERQVAGLRLVDGGRDRQNLLSLLSVEYDWCTKL